MYGVQEASRNKRYANKEFKRNLAGVGVKIENTSNVSVRLTPQNLKVSSATQEKVVLSPSEYASKVKQRVGVHLLHALWGPWAISWREDEDGNTKFKGIYIPAGLIVGVGNAMRASNANQANLATMETSSIWNADIAPGETLYGIVPIPSQSDEALIFSIRSGKSISISSGAEEDFLYTPKEKVVSIPHTFYVVPATGEPYNVTSKIHIDEGKHYIIRKDENNASTRVYPSDTQTLSRMGETKKQLLGLPNGDQWLFKVIEGKINGYFFLAEDKTNVLSKIQKGDGRLIPFSPRNLLTMIEGHPDATALINKGAYLEAIRVFNAKR